MTREYYEEQLKLLAEERKEYEKSVVEATRLIPNAMTRAEFEARQKDLRDRIAEIAYGEDRGRERGIAECIARGREQGFAEGYEQGFAEGYS